MSTINPKYRDILAKSRKIQAATKRGSPNYVVPSQDPDVAFFSNKLAESLGVPVVYFKNPTRITDVLKLQDAQCKKRGAQFGKFLLKKFFHGKNWIVQDGKRVYGTRINNRFYPNKVMDECMAEFETVIKENSNVGEVQHPGVTP